MSLAMLAPSVGQGMREALGLLVVLCAVACSRSEAAVAIEVAPAAAQTDRPEQVVQRINPAPGASASAASPAAALPAAALPGGSLPGASLPGASSLPGAVPAASGSVGSSTSGGQAITPKHLETELNRLEAELTR